MGKIIVFEGCEDTGKTTQINRVAEILCNKGFTVATMEYPSRRTDAGRRFLDWLENKGGGHGSNSMTPLQAFFFNAIDQYSDYQLLEEVVDLKDFVLLDRWYLSNIIYGMAKGMPEDLCKQMYDGLPAPALWIGMLISKEETWKRAGDGGDLHESNKKLINKVVDFYTKQATKELNLVHGPFHWVDGELSEEEVTSQIMSSSILKSLIIGRNCHGRGQNGSIENIPHSGQKIENPPAGDKVCIRF